ncbi:MAG: hypothetical protein QXD89_02680 [Candidatus Aenigmatarchaeota archaeon]
MVEKFMEEKETVFWKADKRGIKCRVCQLSCNIPEKKRGQCEVRENKNSFLYLSGFGNIDGLEINKVEERGLYHFSPNSLVLAVDLKSPPNFKILQSVKSQKKKMKPQEIVLYAKSKGARSILFTGSEPVGHYEYVVKVFREAKRSNVKTILGSAGLLQEDPIKKIAKYTDALVYYFFASGNEEYYRKNTILKNVDISFNTLKFFYRYRIFTEVVNILKKGYESEESCEKLATWIVTHIGAETPLHIMKGDSKLNLNDLKNLHLKCKEAGLRYVYIDGVKDPSLSNTYCHNCGNLIAERIGNKLKSLNLSGDRCPNCGIKHTFILE